MDKEQERLYGAQVQSWKDTVKAMATGWDEDGPEIPVDYPLDVNMCRYYLGGEFLVDIGHSESGRLPETPQLHTITNPLCEIEARVRKVKAHMNRMISAMEYASRDHRNVWELVEQATRNLRVAHHGSRYRTCARSRIIQKLKAHCTGIPSSLPWEVGFGYILQNAGDAAYLPTEEGPDESAWSGTYETRLRATMFTVCPFVMFETGGCQSHTQRTHIEIELYSTAPVFIRAIMGEITTRLVPVMSNMKIPDEVVQVLKSYAGPTFTEDGAVRVMKILRGITGEFCPEGEIITCKVRAISEDSHLAHDIETSIENDLS